MKDLKVHEDPVTEEDADELPTVQQLLKGSTGKLAGSTSAGEAGNGEV